MTIADTLCRHTHKHVEVIFAFGTYVTLFEIEVQNTGILYLDLAKPCECNGNV